MLRNILKLNGIQEISKEEQKKVNGGIIPEGCTLEVYSGMTKPDCLAEGGVYTATRLCRMLVCSTPL